MCLQYGSTASFSYSFTQAAVNVRRFHVVVFFVSVQGSRDAEGLFRITRFGGIQPARVMEATTGIGADRRTARSLCPRGLRGKD